MSPAVVPATDQIVQAGRDQCFDLGWRFRRGDGEHCDAPELNDSEWRTVDIPHDWSIEDVEPGAAASAASQAVAVSSASWYLPGVPGTIGPFDRQRSEGGNAIGWTVGGVGWYRKHFRVGTVPPGSKVELRFDGAYMTADVWLNGAILGSHEYGYAPFSVDLTKHLQKDGDNVVAVRVSNLGATRGGIPAQAFIDTCGSMRPAPPASLAWASQSRPGWLRRVPLRCGFACILRGHNRVLTSAPGSSLRMGKRWLIRVLLRQRKWMSRAMEVKGAKSRSASGAAIDPWSLGETDLPALWARRHLGQRAPAKEWKCRPSTPLAGRPPVARGRGVLVSRRGAGGYAATGRYSWMSPPSTSWRWTANPAGRLGPVRPAGTPRSMPR
jgi:hypothetical protein